jgi:SAM-dependent methyltransferase
MNGEARITTAGWADEGRALEIVFEIGAPLLFGLDMRIGLAGQDGEERLLARSHESGLHLPWLPRGTYRLRYSGLPADDHAGGRLRIGLWADCDHAPREIGHAGIDSAGTRRRGEETAGLQSPAWKLECPGGEVDLESLSWNRGEGDWFFRHFDHAAGVITGLLLDHSPLLGGRVLDVGCGDGITDLSVFHRCRPELLVGIDPYRSYEGLEEIARENQVPDDWLGDERLRFEPHDGNDIPYQDDSFDVVLSWGAVEHVAGGYGGVLDEIHRVLRHGGLFFCLTGLYYGPTGNHLGEFFDDPWIHLKLDEGDLRRRLLSRRPSYMDRCGVFASPEEYWHWYQELNHITVGQFEADLRQRGFEPWRVALRHCDLVEYTPELQDYSFTDLATSELYVSAWNRKRSAGPGGDRHR